MPEDQEENRPLFEEQAAQRELERLHRAIEETRGRRRRANEAFDKFLKSFDERPSRAPVLPAPEQALDFAAADEVLRTSPSPVATPAAAPPFVPRPDATGRSSSADATASVAAPATPISPFGTTESMSRPGPTALMPTPSLPAAAAAEPSVPRSPAERSDAQSSSADRSDAQWSSADRPAAQSLSAEGSDALPAALSSPAYVRVRSPNGAAAAAVLAVALAVAVVAWRGRGGEQSGREVQLAPAPAASAPAPVPTPTSGREKPPPAELVTARRVWMRVTVDGARLMEREVAENTRIPLKPTSQVVVRAGDAGAVRVLIDGKDLGPVGPNGQVVTRTYPVPATR